MLTDRFPVNVVVCGVGGQGNVLVSQILGHMMQRAGFVVTIGETYGASQRGGSVMSHVRLSPSLQLGPLIPEGTADLIVGLEPAETLRMLEPYGHPGVKVLTNTRTVEALEPTGARAPYPSLEVIFDHLRELSDRAWTIEATELALSLGDAILTNMVMLGALCELKLLPFDRRAFDLAVREVLPRADTASNARAFQMGRDAVSLIDPDPSGRRPPRGSPG